MNNMMWMKQKLLIPKEHDFLEDSTNEDVQFLVNENVNLRIPLGVGEICEKCHF